MPSKLYLQTHLFAFSFALSAALSGLLTLLVPSVRAQSLTLGVLPESVTYLLGALSFLGGISCVYGIWGLKIRFEGAGFTALAAVQLASLVNSVAALGFGTSILGICLRGGLGIGCLLRAFYLARLP